MKHIPKNRTKKQLKKLITSTSFRTNLAMNLIQAPTTTAQSNVLNKGLKHVSTPPHVSLGTVLTS